MKANKKSRLSDLSVDVVEYMFLEWLIRRDLYSAYRANYENVQSDHRSFRDNLRAEIRFLSHASDLGVENIVSTSFLFDMTPEGFSFWKDKSDLWRRFCSEFKSIL